MKQHRDMILTSQVLDSSALARYVESFGEKSSGWEFPAGKSSLYEQTCQQPSCCIVAAAEPLPHAAVHFTEKSNNSIYVTNIIPLERSQLSMDECNSVLVALSHQLRAHSRSNGESISIKLSKAEVRLSDIIPGNVVKELWNRYLRQYPLSGHPLDVQRLDIFICALSRYKRRPFNLEVFEALLVEECGWSSKDARQCRNRVQTGLQILETNRNF